MKKHLFFLFIIFASRSFSQNYYMNAVNGTTITTCKGNVLPSWQCTNLFAESVYCNNENYTVTFYSGNPLIPMRISFLPLYMAGYNTNNCFYTEAGYDFLTIINGPSVGSPTLATLSGAIAGPFNYTSTGPYLTIKFKSDGSNVDWGWYAILGCQPQGCNGNVPAGDVCSTAPALCDINGYCGSTNGWYTPDNMNIGVNLGGPFCGASGSIENNAWIKFIPNAANASININVANCSSPTQGLQAGLFSTPNCSSFTQLTCQSQSAYAPVMTLSYNSFVPGNTYYLMVDGYAGNACDYTVTANSGVAVSTVNVSSNTICNGQSTNLTAVAAGSSPTYAWSTGATSSGITVSPNNTTAYTATISSGFCTEIFTKTITVNPIPAANAGASPGNITCNNPTQTLSGSGGGSYSWSGPGIVSGSATANPVVNQGGTYTLTVTSAGCTSTNVATVTLGMNTTAPGATITAPAVLNCTNTTISLNGNTTSGNSFNWTGPSGFTSTNQNPSVTQPGTYNFTVTNTASGCKSTTNANVTQNISVVGVTATASSSLNCNNPTAVISLTSNSATPSYITTGPGIVSGSTTSLVTINAGGTYNYTVTNSANGCTTTGAIAVAQNNTPVTVTATPSSSLNCITTSANIALTTTSSPVTYTTTGPGITGGSNSSNISVNSGGTFNYTVTNTFNGCKTVGSTVITQNNTAPGATITAPAVLNCTNTSTNLNGTTTSGNSFNWTGPSGFTSTNQNPAVTQPGTYNFTVTNTANGCTSITNANVNQNISVVGVTATASSSLNCNNATAVISLTSNSASATYITTGPGIVSGSTTSLVTINAGGTYNYSVTNTANGCVTSNAIAIAQNNTPVVVTATPSSSLNCTVTTANIALTTTSSPASYTTTGPGVTGGSNSNNVSVNAGGTYNYTVTNTFNGCKSIGSVSVTQNTTPPAASINPPAAINCTNSSVTLNGNPASGVTYNWTGPSGFTSTNANPTVTLQGTYNLTVTSTSNNCKSTVSTNVVQNTTVSASATTNGTVTCDPNTGSINLFASPGGMNYTWTPPGGSSVTSGQNSPNATGYGAGTYSLFIYNPTNGCTASTSVAAYTDMVQGPPNATSTGTVKCSTYTLNLNSTTSGVTYTWVPPAGSSVSAANSASTTANGGGTYTLLVTNAANSCTNVSTVAVITQTAKPVPNITNNPTITCTNTMVTINGSPGAGFTHTWTGTGISGSANNTNVNVTSAGVYSFAVTSNSNGCTSTAPATVNITANTASPSISIGSNQTIPCSPASVQVTSTVTPGTATVSWSGPNVCGGATSATATACAPGVYTLTATNPSNGCLVKSTVTVNPSPGLNVNVTNTGSILCNPASVQVIASATPATNNTYAWSGPGIVSGAGTSTITVNQPGTYSVVVTNTPSGCSFNFNNVVSADNSPITPNASVSNTVDCTTSSALITTTPSPSGAFNYSWDTGAGTSSITVTPTTTTNYVVTVTNTANGCTGTQTISVTANTNPPTGVSVSPNNFTVSCSTPTTMLTANATGAVSYTWMTSNGTYISSTNQSTAEVSGGGTYSVIATGANGCSAAAAVATITPDSNQPQFNLSNSSPSITCNNASPGVSVIMTSTGSVTYSWSPASGISGSSTSSLVSFTAPGTYTGLITASNGCTNTAVITVGTDTTSPSVIAGTGTAQALSCTNTIVTIAPAFTPSANLNYLWSGPGIVGSNSGSSIQANQNGSYSLTVTNTLTGCSTTSISIPVSGSNIPPTLTVTSSSSIGIGCQPGTSTVGLNAQSGSGNVSYSWNTGASTQSIFAASAGVYTVTVTENGSNCSTASTIAVQNNTTAPNISSSASGNLPCGGGTTSLSAVSSNTNVSYTWAGNGVVSGSTSAAAVVNQAGTFTVTVVDNITGCSSTSTVSIANSSVTALAVADVTAGTAPLTVNFSNQSLGATTYSWSFGDGNSSSQSNPSNTFANSGTYTVTLVSSNGACSASDIIYIQVLESLGIIPEVFTPNHDNYNDQFIINGIDSYPNNSLQVFNRWGNPVYSAKPYKNDWDGSPNVQGKTGSGQLPTGTYFYLLELGDTNKTIFKGYIQIQY